MILVFLFVIVVCLFLFCFVLFFSRQDFSVQSWLSWNSLCRPGWPPTQKYAYLCLPSAGIKGMCHHCLTFLSFFKRINCHQAFNSSTQEQRSRQIFVSSARALYRIPAPSPFQRQVSLCSAGWPKTERPVSFCLEGHPSLLSLFGMVSRSSLC